MNFGYHVYVKRIIVILFDSDMQKIRSMCKNSKIVLTAVIPDLMFESWHDWLYSWCCRFTWLVTV